MKDTYEEYLYDTNGEDLHYKLIVNPDNQIVLYNCRPPYDPFDTFDFSEPDNTTTRVVQDNPYKGMIVYKALARAVFKYLWEYRPPTMYFTTDSDDTRLKLYNFFARTIEKACNYTCYFKDETSFYFYRNTNNFK